MSGGGGSNEKELGGLRRVGGPKSGGLGAAGVHTTARDPKRAHLRFAGGGVRERAKPRPRWAQIGLQTRIGPRATKDQKLDRAKVERVKVERGRTRS